MKLGEIAAKSRATVFFAIAAVAIAGLSAYVSLPRESFPDISIPNILVYTLWPGASPSDVETQITDELERELQGLEGIKEVTSTSSESVSTVNVEFVSGTDLDFALQKVRDRVNIAKAEFPTDAEEPILRELNFSDVPIVQIHLSGDLGPVELRRIAKELQDEIEAIPGVLRATLVGGVEREVQVDLDPERLRLYGVALDGDGTVAIPDSDGGELDGDAEHDRAMGPMQLIPQTWRNWHVDGGGDGVEDPQNIDDAGFAYKALSQNSNTVIGAVLDVVGIDIRDFLPNPRGTSYQRAAFTTNCLQ